MTEPVALQDLKTHLRLDQSATDEDSYLTGQITAARRACELEIDQSVVGAIDVLVLDKFPGVEQHFLPILSAEARNPRARDIALAGGAVTSITSISYIDPNGDAQLLGSDAYITELVEQPAMVAPIGRWPATAEQPGAVIITYVVSPLSADDTAIVAQAMMLLIGHWYRNRESVAVDVRGTPIELPNSVTWMLEKVTKWTTE